MSGGLLRSLRERAGLEDRGWATTVGALLLVRLALDLLAALTTPGFLHPDEHFQTVELAALKLGWSNPDAAPWELARRIRPWLQPGLYVLVARAFAISEPFTLIAVLRGVSALATALGTAALAAALPRWLPAPGPRRWALVFTLFAPWAPTLAARTSSETLSTAALAVALGALTLIGDRGRAADRLDAALAGAGGLALGLAFHLRYQTGFVTVGVLAFGILVARWPRPVLLATGAGLAVALVVGLGVDRWGYGEWTLTPWRYLEANLVEGRAASFGVRPWWAYLGLLWHDLPKPFGALALLLPLAGLVAHRRHLLAFAWVPFLVAHAAIGHKETRFLFPFLAFAPTLAALGAAPALSRWRPRGVRALLFALLATMMLELALWRPPLLGGWLEAAVRASPPDGELFYTGPSPLETPLVPRSLLGARSLVPSSEPALLARLARRPTEPLVLLRAETPWTAELSRRCRRLARDPARLEALPEVVRSSRPLRSFLGIRRSLEVLSCGGAR
jgi:hypothetical protein